MKSLTVLQPWASLIALGKKSIETRHWYTRYRGPMAIHAGKSEKYYYYAGECLVFKEPFYSALKQFLTPSGGVLLPLGAVIAICQLTGCIEIDDYYDHPWFLNPEKLSEEERAYGDYTPGRYAWLLDNIQMLPKPIPVKGRQGLWEWKERNVISDQN